MLLEFGVKNFFCFKEGATISFKLDRNCPEHISHGKSFANIMCVKGANGSGKTHVLKGLSFIAWFTTSSFQSKPEAPVGALPYFTSNKPSELYADFAVGGTTYRYEVSTTDKEVKRETIYRTKGRKIKVVERKANKITTRIAEFSRLDSIQLRSNASIVATAHQYAFDELDVIYDFFKKVFSNVNFGGLLEGAIDITTIASHMHNDQSMLSFVKNFVSQCDTGISDIKILKTKNKEEQDEYFPVFIHEVEGKQYHLPRHIESSGTKMLFRELPRYKFVLEDGGVLILDEFDMHLHPHILPKLIQLFEDPETNKHDAQLLFTTHDSEILNYLGRYRTYLVNKEQNTSFVYRLDEIPGDILRNDRPILPAYNEGKIGGIPKL